MKAMNFLFVITALLLTACSGNEPAPKETTPAAVNEVAIEHPGKSLFEEKCAVCHGNNGAAGIANAANLRTSKLDSAVIATMVTEGKNAMPAFKNQLSEDDINKLADYVFNKLRAK